MLFRSEGRKLRDQVNEELRNSLITAGREGEVVFREAWPIQRLALAGKLPPSLQRILEAVNSIKGLLAAQEDPVGPTSQLGQNQFQALTNWMFQVHFVQNPQAKTDLDQLGLFMYDEPLLSAVLPKLLYGDFGFGGGTLEPVR